MFLFKNLIRHINLFFGLFLYVVVSCSQNHQPDYVAEWKHIKVTLPDFERSYFNSWQTLNGPDSPDQRKKFLRQIIEQQIIAEQYAPQTDSLKEAKIQRLLNLDNERFMRRRFLETTIKDTISDPAKDEIEKALIRKNKTLYIKNFFSNDPEYIQKVNSQIESGKALNDILTELKSDKGKKWDYAENWIKWGDLDLDTENKLYNQKPYSTSEPVKSLLGWHIFQIDSVRTVYQFNSSQIAKEASDTRNQLKYRKLERAAAPFIKDLVQSKNLVMSMKTARKIWDYINSAFSDSKSQNPAVLIDKFVSEMPQDFLKTPVAWVDDKIFTVQDFIDRIPDLPRNLIKPNLRNAIEIAIRDKILAAEALAHGLQDDPVVIEKTRRARINYHYMAMVSAKSNIENQDTFSPEEYYQQNRTNYIKSISSKINEIRAAGPDEAISIAKKMYSGEDLNGYKSNIYWVDSDAGNLGKRAGKLKINDVFAPIKSDSFYSAIKVLEKHIEYFDYQDVERRVQKDLDRNFLKSVHYSLLPSDYSPDQIIYYEDNIDKALTPDSKTIF